MRYLALLLILPACVAEQGSPAQSPRSALDHLEVEPIGGGENYGDWVPPSGPIVGDLQQLRDRLGASAPGEVITVADDARILVDMSGDACELTVPPGVTLAGGRGRDGELGALIASRSENRALEGRPSLLCLSPGARLTGLRIQGSTLAADWSGCGGGNLRAITATGANDGADLDIRIDNNEVYGWTVAVDIRRGSGVTVDHNHIHHNQRQELPAPTCRGYSLGYGVVISTGATPQGGGPQASDATIEANLFHHNRHDIAADGNRGSSYTARYNLIHDARISHSFDVHQGDQVIPGGVEPNGIAGESFEIAHNTFLQDTQRAIVLRAVPSVGAHIHDNEFRTDDPERAIWQVYDDTGEEINPFDHITAERNTLESDHNYAWFMAPGAASGPLNQGDEVGEFTLGGEGTPIDREPGFWTLRRFDDTSMDSVAVGDFDCDGADDVFRKKGSAWQYSSGARGDWTHLNSSNVSFSSLRFGDFDGNGCTDVFRAHPGAHRWYVSWNGTSGWKELNISGVAVEHLGFGDFNADGKTDVFRGDGSAWQVSYGGSSAWSFLNNSSVRAEGLRFHDFNGDGRTDVFRANGSKWYASLGGTSSWVEFGTSSITADGLGFGDFDGDGTTDALRRGWSSGKWEVSWGARSFWEKTRTSNFFPWSLRFGDFNGDGATDILSMQYIQ